MSYVNPNFPTKKKLKEAVAAGETVTVFEPGGLFPAPDPNGIAFVEGPHYPRPHSWYAQVTLVDGKITKVK